MTNFLSAAAVSEAIQELHEGCRYLEMLLGMNDAERARFVAANARKGLPTTIDEEVRKTVESMRATAHAAKEFLDGMQSQPIIYTGEGSTEDVLAMLERLFAAHAKEAASSGKRGANPVQLEFGR
ncbi:MAG: hypothetical protein ACM3XN_08555 [Chloroflexota bacterium]